MRSTDLTSTLNVIKIFCLDLSRGCVRFETFDYFRMPHQRAFDPIFLSNPHPLPTPVPPGINLDRCINTSIWLNILTWIGFDNFGSDRILNISQLSDYERPIRSDAHLYSVTFSIPLNIFKNLNIN
jgi:hypothetical protein